MNEKLESAGLGFHMKAREMLGKKNVFEQSLMFYNRFSILVQFQVVFHYAIWHIELMICLLA